LNWDFAQPVHTWEGIVLENNRVREMELNTVGLSGSVPNLNLPYLKQLYLGDNNLTGPIPDSELF